MEVGEGPVSGQGKGWRNRWWLGGGGGYLVCSDIRPYTPSPKLLYSICRIS